MGFGCWLLTVGFSMKKKVFISLSLGIVISFASLYFAFKNVPFDELSAYMSAIDGFWTTISVLIVVLCFVLRAIRWQVIVGSTRKIGFLQAFHPLMIGFMINCILPGRAGEVARPVILQKNEQVPFSTGLATVAAERIFDFMLLIVFFAFVLTTIEIDPDLEMTFGKFHLNRETLISVGTGMGKLSILLIAGIVMLTIEKSRRLIKKLIQMIPAIFFWTGSEAREKIKLKICTPLSGLVDHLSDGFELLKHPEKIGACIGLSSIIWGLSAFSYYTMSLGCPGVALSFLEISGVMIIVCFFIALPSVPGFWGLWEAGGIFALTLFGISTSHAAGYTLANHAVQMFPIILIGFGSAVATGINILKVSYGKETEVECPRVKADS